MLKHHFWFQEITNPTDAWEREGPALLRWFERGKYGGAVKVFEHRLDELLASFQLHYEMYAWSTMLIMNDVSFSGGERESEGRREAP